jgi:GT2 family glycosyltransferase
MTHDPPPPEVTVVIVSWNAREFLRGCLDSLAANPGRRPMEVIVVDNGSQDGSPECVAEEHPQVRLVRVRSNLGFARANNLGLAVSRGRWLLLVNSDVVVLPGCIDALIDRLESDPGAGMAGPRITGGDGLLQRSCRGFPTLWNMACRAFGLDTAFPRFAPFCGYALRHWPQEDTRVVDILTGCFWAVRREAWLQVGGLDEAFFIYGEDMDWCRRFHEAGWRRTFLASAHAIHYGGGSSRNAPVRFFLEKQKADLQYWRKHHSAAGAAAYLALSMLHMALRIAGYAARAALRRGDLAGLRYKVERSVECLRLLARTAREDLRGLRGRQGGEPS